MYIPPDVIYLKKKTKLCNKLFYVFFKLNGIINQHYQEFIHFLFFLTKKETFSEI